MAEGDGAIYNNFKEQVLLGNINLGNGGDTLKLILVAGHSPDIDSHASYADVSGDEESGTGYSAGGEALTSQAVTQDNDNDRAKFDAANVTWTGLDVGTPSHCILYDDTPSSNPLIAYWELATASNGGDYTIQWHTDGVLLLT